MSILRRAMEGEERATSTLKNPSSWLIQALAGNGAISASGVAVSGVSAMSNSAFYACVRALSDAGASMPLRSYRHTPSGREVVPPRPFTAAGLIDRPAPGLSQASLVANMISSLATYGNAFYAKVRGGTPGALPVMLIPVSPTRVYIRMLDGEPLYTVTEGDGSTLHGKDFTRHEILHIKGLTLDGVIGLSPVSQARTAIGLGMALEEFASRYFSNSAIPGGVIKTQKTLSEDAAKRLKADWESMHRGSRNSNRVGVLEEGMEWQAVTSSMLDAQFIEQRKMSATEIARIMRVPPWIIAADSGSSMTYSNVEQQVAGFLTFAVRPWLVFIEQALSADDDLYPADRSVWPEFYMDSLLKADASTRALVYKAGLAGHGWLTVNDVRRMENLDAVEGGDEVPAAKPPAQHDPNNAMPDPDPNAVPTPTE